MEPDTSKTAYANDESNAEQGPRDSNTSEELAFRKDAHVWYLYLEDAEREANEKAEQWKSGLDSLLIFAGLFGGIVSSFVLDARKDLQVDSEQNLLSDIRQTLLSGSIGQTPGVSTATEWVNGLWILSLYITLFSAITGVLAKAWLANYVSVTKRREAEDAYNRYQLDKQADQWYLKEVITIVPLLLQVATFLFLVGLVIRGYGDSPTLSIVLLAFCAAGGIIYLLMTVLPLMSPTSPFNTPLSDFLRWLKRMWVALRRWKPSKPTSVPQEMQINQGLAEILYKKSIKSPKASHVNAAIAEIALPSFKEDWCATDLTHDGAVQHPAILGNCLLALLRSVKCIEESMSSRNGNTWHIPDVTQRNALAVQLRKSLSEPGNPLHRWNSLPEGFRPLLFSLRTQVLHLLPLLDWSHVDSKPDVDFGDFDANELADQPWHMAWQDISSNHRIHFTVAASRGVLHGQKYMKMVSSMILGLCLARAAHTAIDTGHVSEWVGFTNTEKKRDDIGKLVSTYLEKLYETTASAWGDMAIDALSLYLHVPSLSVTVADLRSTDTLQTLDVLRSLLSALAFEHRPLPLHAVKMLEHVPVPGGELFDTIQTLQQNFDQNGSLARADSQQIPTLREADTPLLKESGHLSMVETIATLIVSENQYGVRELGIQILENLARTGEDLRAQIASILVVSIESALVKPESHPPMSALDFLRTLYGMPDSPLYNCIHQVMFSAVDVALSPNQNEVSQLALCMVHDLWTQVEFQADIKKAVTEYLRTSLYETSNLTPESVDGINLKTVILSSRESIVTHRWDNPRKCASWIPLLGDMAKHVHFPEAIPIMLELWNEANIYEDEVSQDTENSLLSVLGNEEFWAGDPEYPAALENAIPDDLRVLSDGPISDWLRVEKWVNLLVSLAAQPEFRELMKDDLISNCNSFLSNDDWRVRQFSVKLLASLGFSKEWQLPENILEGLKDMALSDLDADVQSEAINALSNLLEAHAEEYHDSIVPTIDQHSESGIEDTERKVRLAWGRLASSQINDVDFPRVQKLINATVKEKDDGVRTEAVATLQKILKSVPYVRTAVLQQKLTSRLAKLRARMATELGKILDSSLRNPELAERAISIYTTLTARESTPEGRQRSTERHHLWVEIIVLLGRYSEFQTLNKLIEQTIKEDWSGVGFPSLDILFKTVNLKLPESLNNILPKALEFSLDLEKNATTEARAQATELFGRLIGCMPNEVIKHSIQTQERVDIRVNAAQAVDSLTRTAAGDRFHDIISPSVPLLLRIGLTDGDSQHEDLRKDIKKILFTNLGSFAEEIKLNRDILTEIPHLITIISLTLGGKEAVLELVDKLTITDKTAASIARALTPILRNTSSSWVARTASIDLLSRLHAKHARTWPRLIEPAIHEIIAVALDDKDPIRKTAVQLLASLATPPTGPEDGSGDSHVLQVNANMGFREEIMRHGKQFIGLLKDEHLRSSVVELLSILSTDIEMRRKISMSILTSAMSTELKSFVFVGQVELLARLISDGRFLHEPIDIVMLLVASALVTRPILRNTPYRLEILTALWCRYKLRDVPTTAFEHRDLIDWFAFGLFGRHTTVNEVETWSKGCKEWLRKIGSS
ncbi:hypothetical protein H1R20_g3973, partial [Candolleomyces eurysporus]